ncbi:MAG: VWA domain-containing protein [Alphaproteobacteria bacterium]|nr:VWA domain-containing protein [Alphaproteobacteria bacterium]
MEITVLRPWALIFLLPAVLFCFFRLKSVQAWLGIVDAHLLKPLAVKTYVRLKERLNAFFLIVCVCSFLAALAGVSLKSDKTPLYYPKSPAVIVLDMSLSMKIQDIQPNRFSRAIFKIYDLLEELKGNPVALVVFTDEPYQLIPITTDKDVIESVLPLLNFSLMPSQGSRTDRALKEALRTIEETGAGFGDIFLITDGADDVFEIQDMTQELVRSAAQKGNRLFILGVGTLKGGRLLEKEDKPVFDALGNPVMHRLKEGYLKLLAKQGNGKYAGIQTDNSDISALIKARSALSAGKESLVTDPSLGDTGYWFLILPLIGFPFLFQKGRLLVGLLIFLTAFPARADVADAFLSPSGAAMRQLERGDRSAAVATAERSNDFTALYNVGTKMILLQNYSQAVLLLEKAVQLKPDNEDAQINWEIAKRLNENPPDDESPNAGENDQSQNPDQSDDGQGDSEGENNLNQNNNNDSQDTDNKENNNQKDDENNRGENQESPSSDSDGNNPEPEGNQNETPASDEAGNGKNNDDEEPPDSENKMFPVHEDPLTLLRHKILFLYQERRYNQEKQIGAPW